MDEAAEGAFGAIRAGSVRQLFASEHDNQWSLVDAVYFRGLSVAVSQTAAC
jgi:hypothetical protein